jgi:hypothetical protein
MGETLTPRNRPSDLDEQEEAWWWPARSLMAQMKQDLAAYQILIPITRPTYLYWL